MSNIIQAFLLPDGKDFILTDEIIVLFEEGVKETEKIRLRDKYGVKEINRIGNDLVFYQLKEKSTFNTLEIADKYQKETSVKSATPNFLADIFKLNVIPNDKYLLPNYYVDWNKYNKNNIHQWALFRICAESGWSFNKGANTKVMVLDSGADLKHEDLEGKITGDDNNFNVLDGWPRNHGSSVAGIIAITGGVYMEEQGMDMAALRYKDNCDVCIPTPTSTITPTP